MPPFLPQQGLNLGSMRVDTSPLRQMFGDIENRQQAAQQKATLADIGKAAATGDYTLAQNKAYESGQLGVGNQFGQMQRQRQMDSRKPQGPAPTSLVRNLVAAGLQPGTPEFQKAILEKINRSNAPQVTVNNRGETEFAKKFGGHRAQRAIDAISAGDSANATLDKLTQIDEVLNNPNLYTGPGGSMVQGGKSVLAGLGFDVEGQGEGALLKTLTADLALQDLQGFKGATSNKELDFVLQKAPGISNTREGNRLLVSTKRLEQQHVAAKAGLYQRYNGQPPRGEINKLNANTRRQLRGYIKAMRKIKVQQPAPTAGIPVPSGWSVNEK